MLRPMILVAAGVCAAACSVCVAQDGASTLTLTSGEVMSVTVLELSAESVRVSHPLLGELTIPAEGIRSINGAVYEPVVDQIAAQPEEVVAEEVASPWVSSFELGLNGVAGNTKNANGRVAFRTEREIEGEERFTFLTRYKQATTNGDDTENEWYTSALQEWYLPESPKWSVFVTADAEVDKFQEWDVRYSGAAGLGYIFIDDEVTSLRGRVGVGGSFESGAENEEFIPEALLGYEFRRKLNERSRFRSVGILYPSLGDVGEFRSYLDAAYEIDMTDAGDWSLRIGLDHQYDSDTEVRPWDFSYYAALVLSF